MPTTTPVLNKFVTAALEKIASNERFTNYKIEVLSELKCQGFSSVLIPVVLVNRVDCMVSVKELIIKSPPTNEKLRETLPFDKIFKREVFVYDEAFKIFKELQDIKHFSESDLFDAVPICYESSLNYMKEMLILENLSGISNNFRLWDVKKPMTEQHVKLVLEEYGKLHALSFALRLNNLKKLKYIEENTTDIYMEIIKQCKTSEVIKQLCGRILKSLNPKTDSKIIDKLKMFHDSVIDIMTECVDKGAAGEYGVLLHGDNWCNNMLFSYEDKTSENTPTKVKLVDWQLSRFGSPVLDLSYFLYTSAPQLLLENLDELLHTYHNSLSNFLTKLGCNVNTTFPFNVLTEHWKKFAQFGLGMAFLVVHVMFMDKDETPDVSENQSADDFISSFVSKTKNDALYEERMKVILYHFVHNNFL